MSKSRKRVLTEFPFSDFDFLISTRVRESLEEFANLSQLKLPFEKIDSLRQNSPLHYIERALQRVLILMLPSEHGYCGEDLSHPNDVGYLLEETRLSDKARIYLEFLSLIQLIQFPEELTPDRIGRIVSTLTMMSKLEVIESQRSKGGKKGAAAKQEENAERNRAILNLRNEKKLTVKDIAVLKDLSEKTIYRILKNMDMY